MEKIICVGNPSIPEDAQAIHLVPHLKKKGLPAHAVTDFEEIVELDQGIIVDVSPDVDKAMLLSVEQLYEFRRNTAHDMDLAFFLQLRYKMGKDHVHIIGIPTTSYKNLVQDVIAIIQEIKEGL